MKVSIKTEVFSARMASVGLGGPWRWRLHVAAGDKHDPTYRTELSSLDTVVRGYRSEALATKGMRQADQAIRQQFRTRGNDLTPRALMAWLRDWSRAQATKPKKKKTVRRK
jgi:hypothetical protein